MESKGKSIHVVMFPWLAMGHLIPFLRLSTHLAQKGHKISFISTPNNLKKLPKIPSNLTHLINLITLPFPHIPSLPQNAESSADIPTSQAYLLKNAYDSLQLPLTDFLHQTAPDWIIYDYASPWLPPLAGKLGISRAYFGLFTAACLSFMGPPSLMKINGGDLRSKPEDLTVVPKWVTFESNVKYYLHEVMVIEDDSLTGSESGTSDWVRFGISIEESDIVVIRSCTEFEPEWLSLLSELYRKPVMPVGFLPPLIEDCEEKDERWVSIKGWLDCQQLGSVIYVALGTESRPSQDQLSELALGLEQSELPFFWVLRTRPWENQDELDMLPDGFVERVKGRGIIHMGWVPQIKILSHDSVGGFLTHCGLNSVIEGLGFGRVLVMLPLINEQGLNARLLHGKKLGIEIPRIVQDGSFTRDSVAESVKLAMVSEEGESLRATVKEMKGLFGDRSRNDHCVDGFIRYLEDNRPQPLEGVSPPK